MSAALSALVPSDTALQDEQRVGAGGVAQRLGGGDGVVTDERQRGRADEQLLEPLEAGLVGGEPGQGVLVHLVLGAGVAQRAAQRGQGADVHPAVLRDEHGLGGVSLAAISSTMATFSARGLSISVHTSSRVRRGGSLQERAPRQRPAWGVHLGWRGRIPLPTARAGGPAVCGEQPV